MYPFLLATSEIPLIDIDGTIFVQLALFLALIFVLNGLLFRPYLRLQEQRDDAIEGRIKEAAELESRAKMNIAEVEAHLQEAKIRGSKERADIRSAGAKREIEIVQQAAAEVAAKQEEARRELEVRADQLRVELSPRVGELAERITNQIAGGAV